MVNILKVSVRNKRKDSKSCVSLNKIILCIHYFQLMWNFSMHFFPFFNGRHCTLFYFYFFIIYLMNLWNGISLDIMSLYFKSWWLFVFVSHCRSLSPRGRRSPRRRSVTPPRRGRSYSRSPPYRRARHDSPYANGYVLFL